LYEDPGIEVEDYYSDWEYYTDDYYDDDPTVKPGTVAKTSETKPRRANRAPRPQSSIKPDITSFQGVVWKTSSLEKEHDLAVQIYEPGAGEQVALLKNWREIFKSAQPALDKSRLRKKKAQEMREPDSALADDEFPCEAEDESSDTMSDIVSLNTTTESGDPGNASNTTPELVPSPKRESNLAVVVPVKRGRKRKAEVPPETNKKPGETMPRAKRVASKKRDDDGTSASSGPVRRSTRQKK
jgi:hypothetical protein